LTTALQAVSPAQGRAAALDVAEVIRGLDQCLRWEDAVLGEDAVDGAAERSAHFCLARFTTDPSFEEAADHAIAWCKLANVRADRLGDASAVGDRHQRKFLTRAVTALDGEQVAIVERGRLEAYQNLARSGLRQGLSTRASPSTPLGP
jgi:hypothetical protein